MDEEERKEKLKKYKEENEKYLKEGSPRLNKEAYERSLFVLREEFDNIKAILEKYIDLEKEYYDLIAIWILGTYMHKEFESYPYLFFNAMRGSGKSRTLRLCCKLANEGNVMASPTEAVLFRVTGTLGIDEFERVASKDKNSIRELLNAAYKKGVKIFRMKKKKSLAGEELVPEEFEPYRPILMANIWGMEEVLEDRCITLILEKSDHPEKTRLVEDFDTNNYIQKSVKSLRECSLCSVVSQKNIYKKWNDYIIQRHKTTLNTYNTTTTITTQTTPQQIKTDKLFNKIYDSEIIGRNLELFLPLFFIASEINEETLEKLINLAIYINSSKKHEQEIESMDVMLLDFVSKLEEGINYYSVKQLTLQFREFADESSDWLNTKWFGRALKRLNLVVEKKRKVHGVEVLLNVPKAKKKSAIFRSKHKLE